MASKRSFLSDINPSAIDMDKVKQSIEHKINIINSYGHKANKSKDVNLDKFIRKDSTVLRPKKTHVTISSSKLDHNVVSNRAIKRSKSIDIVSSNLKNNANRIDKNLKINRIRIPEKFLLKNKNDNYSQYVNNIKYEKESVNNIDKLLNQKENITLPYKIPVNSTYVPNVHQDMHSMSDMVSENIPSRLSNLKVLQKNKQEYDLDGLVSRIQKKQNVLYDNQGNKKSDPVYENIALKIPDSGSSNDKALEDNIKDMKYKLDFLKDHVNDTKKNSFDEQVGMKDTAQFNNSIEDRLNALEDKLNKSLSKEINSKNYMAQDYNFQIQKELTNIAQTLSKLERDIMNSSSNNQYNNFLTTEDYKIRSLQNKMASLDIDNHNRALQSSDKEAALRLQSIENQMLHDKILKSVMLTKDIEELKTSQKDIKHILEKQVLNNNVAKQEKEHQPVQSRHYDNGHIKHFSYVSDKLDNLAQMIYGIQKNVMENKNQKNDIMNTVSNQIEDLQTGVNSIISSRDADSSKLQDALKTIESLLSQVAQMCDRQLENDTDLAYKIQSSVDEIKSDMSSNHTTFVDELSNTLFAQFADFENVLHNIFNKLLAEISMVQNSPNPVAQDQSKLKLATQRILNMLKDLISMQEFNLKEMLFLRSSLNTKNTIHDNKFNICIQTLNDIQRSVDDYLNKESSANKLEIIDMPSKATTVASKGVSRNKSKNVDIENNMVYLEGLLKENLKHINKKNKLQP